MVAGSTIRRTYLPGFSSSHDSVTWSRLLLAPCHVVGLPYTPYLILHFRTRLFSRVICIMDCPINAGSDSGTTFGEIRATAAPPIRTQVPGTSPALPRHGTAQLLQLHGGGSLIERCVDLQRKFDGLEKWRSDLVLKSPMAMLLVALALLVYGVCQLDPPFPCILAAAPPRSSCPGLCFTSGLFLLHQSVQPAVAIFLRPSSPKLVRKCRLSRGNANLAF